MDPVPSGRMRRWFAMRSVMALTLSAALASGCAHKQLTNKQVAIGVGAVVGITLLVYLAIAQCNKGANFCDNDADPQ